jgi:uncharacterized membrane protein (DUF2068 family)
MPRRRTRVSQSRRIRDGMGLRIIAVFKLLKAILLVAVGIGAINLLHKNVSEIATNWIAEIRVDPDNRLVHRLIAKLGLMNDRRLEELSIGSFFYAALFLIEGIGLWLRKRWAEYLTIIITCSLIPLELYEIARQVTIIRIAMLLVNLVIVWYLFVQLRRHNK